MRLSLPALIAAVAIVTATSACSYGSQQKFQEVAFDLNDSLRVGHYALEHVAEVEQAKFVARHRDWHHGVRIVDIELVGMQMPKKGDSTITWTVGWQRVDEQEMRSTVIVQRYEEKRGDFYLVDEIAADGDPSIFQGGHANAKINSATAAPVGSFDGRFDTSSLPLPRAGKN